MRFKVLAQYKNVEREREREGYVDLKVDGRTASSGQVRPNGRTKQNKTNFYIRTV